MTKQKVVSKAQTRGEAAVGVSTEPVRLFFSDQGLGEVLDDVRSSAIETRVKAGNTYVISRMGRHLILKTRVEGEMANLPDIVFRTRDNLRNCYIIMPNETVSYVDTNPLIAAVDSDQSLNSFRDRVLEVNNLIFPPDQDKTDVTIDATATLAKLGGLRAFLDERFSRKQSAQKIAASKKKLVSAGIPPKKVDEAIAAFRSMISSAVDLECALYQDAVGLSAFVEHGDKRVLKLVKGAERYWPMLKAFGEAVDPDMADALRVSVRKTILQATSSEEKGRYAEASDELKEQIAVMLTRTHEVAKDMARELAVSVEPPQMAEAFRLLSAVTEGCDVDKAYEGLGTLERTISDAAERTKRGQFVLNNERLYGPCLDMVHGYSTAVAWLKSNAVERAVYESAVPVRDYAGVPLPKVVVETGGNREPLSEYADRVFDVVGYVKIVAEGNLPSGVFAVVDRKGNVTPVPTPQKEEYAGSYYSPQKLLERVMGEGGGEVAGILFIQSNAFDLPEWTAMMQAFNLERTVEQVTGRGIPVTCVVAQFSGKPNSVVLHAHRFEKGGDEVMEAFKLVAQKKTAMSQEFSAVRSEVVHTMQADVEKLNEATASGSRVEPAREHRRSKERAVARFYDFFRGYSQREYGGKPHEELLTELNTRRAKADAELARLGSAGVMRERFQRTLRSVAASSGLMTLRGIDTGRLTDEHYMKAAGIADREFKVDTDNVVSQFSSGMLDAFGRRIYQELFIAGGLSTQSRLIACDQWGVEMSLSLDPAKRALDQKTRDGRFITDGLPKGQNTERIIGDWGALGHAVGPIKPLLGAYLSLPQKEFKRRQAELESVRAMLSASPQALGVLTDLAECGLRAAPAERRALEAVASLLVFDASPLDADARSGMGAKACAFAGVSYDEARRRADEMKSAGNVVQSLKGVVKSVVVPPIESSLGRGSVEKIFDEVYGGPEAEGRLSEFEPTVRAREEMVAAHQKDMQRRGRRRSAPRLSNGAMREVVRAAASSSVEETTALLERVRAEAEAPKPKTNWGLGEGQYLDAFREARKAGITISEKRPKEGLWLSPDDLAYIQARRVAEGMTGVKLAYFVEELAKGRPNIVANVRARLERERELTPAEVEARREEFAKRFMEGFAPPKFAAIPEKSPTLAERDRDAAEAESQRQAAEVKRRERWGAARRKLEEAARGSGPGGRPIALGPPLVVEMAGGDLWAFAKEFFVGDPPTETAKKLESMPLSEMKQLCDEFQLDKPSLLITMWVMTREVGVDLTVGGIRDAVATLSKKVDRPIRVFATAADTPNNSVFAVGEYEYGAGKRPFGLFVNVDRMSEASDESIRKFAESYK